MIDLLAPVGDFECLKAAVQNGADSVYFGADLFSARAFAHNFDIDELKQAIEYAKIRGVKTNLTLNILLKDSEFDSAIKLALKAYEFGIDAIIVQDLGLAMQLIKMFPDLPIHASTQMTIHNLNGALKLQELGFKRVVLARELSMDEITHICKNTDIEIECFIHGALCVSYSGQCLFSSMLGGRSGNRGKCAGPCRLSYDLLENNKKINFGYKLKKALTNLKIFCIIRKTLKFFKNQNTKKMIIVKTQMKSMPQTCQDCSIHLLSVAFGEMSIGCPLLKNWITKEERKEGKVKFPDCPLEEEKK